MTEIDVDGNDVAGLSLTLQPGMTASARVAFDATTAAAPDPANVRLLLTPAAPSQSLPITASTGTAQPDGTWLFKNLVPATYRLIANISPGRAAVANVGWTIKSVIVNGRPATDLPLRIRPGESTALTITFSDKVAEIAGRLVSASGQPAAEFAIVVFTADQTYWGLQSRRTTQVRPQPDGSYRVANLPPGDYYLAAVAGFDPADLANPGFFDQLVAASVRITLAEGEKKTQDLRLAGG